MRFHFLQRKNFRFNFVIKVEPIPQLRRGTTSRCTRKFISNILLIQSRPGFSFQRPIPTDLSPRSLMEIHASFYHIYLLFRLQIMRSPAGQIPRYRVFTRSRRDVPATSKGRYYGSDRRFSTRLSHIAREQFSQAIRPRLLSPRA